MVKIQQDKMIGDLAHFIYEAPPLPALAQFELFYLLDTFVKILVGVKRMHDADFIHFDLKEENIFLMNEFTPVIADLGLSMTKQETIGKLFYRGTNNYIPKYERGNLKAFHRGFETDVYALGLILFYFLYGSRFDFDEYLMASNFAKAKHFAVLR